MYFPMIPYLFMGFSAFSGVGLASLSFDGL